jgi:hypothetical protein
VPEQPRGVPLAPSVDVFAWGSLMAYLSTGFHPFAGRNEADWIRRVGLGRPNLSGLHQSVDAVVRAALRDATQPQRNRALPGRPRPCFKEVESGGFVGRAADASAAGIQSAVRRGASA